MRAFLTYIMLALLAGTARAETSVMELSWGALIPQASAGQVPQPASPVGHVAPKNPFGVQMPLTGPGEAPWMSSRMQQPDTQVPPAVVAELDGKRVRIGGYVVALEFNATQVKEFLLVPFVGACIHVPPPPANQIIYVKAAEGFEIKGQFDPVYVTGTLKTLRQYTGLAATGYTIEDARVSMRKE